MSSSCEGIAPIPAGTTFTVWDYLVFSIILVMSAAIGIYYACSGGKQKTTAEFLLADKSMSAIPVALSLFVSFFSAVTLLGVPAEIYTQGTMYWMAIWGVMLTPILGATVFGPFFHRLKIISAFETFTLGIVMFAPSTAFTQVTGFPVWATIVTIGIVCAFYTTVGGLKAIIWADVFQATIMFAGMLAAIIQGCIKVGGIQKVWKLAEDGGRIEFFDFNPDPTVRHTFWTLVVGNYLLALPYYTVDQQMVQRYASTKSTRQAKIALLLNVPVMFVLKTLGSLLGVVMYGYYADLKCDPLKSGRVTNPNQLVPRFVMDVFHFAPGVTGLYVASLFAGSLSTISSVLNVAATVVWEDIFKMFRPAREASDKTATMATKFLGVFFSACGIGMAFAFSNASGTVLQMLVAFHGVSIAPVFGIYLLGIFCPWTNWIGALAGGISGFVFPMWISIGAYVTKPPVFKPMYYDVACCGVAPENSTSSYFSSTTDYYTTTPSTTAPEASGIAGLYSLSYLWYTTLGTLTTIVVGLIVSFMTGYTKAKDVDPKLLIPYVDRFWRCFPESCRSKFRCGIDHSKAEHSDSMFENENSDKTAKVFSNEMKNVISVFADGTNLEGNDKTPCLDDHDGSSEIIVHSSNEPIALKENSNRSVHDHNDDYYSECLNEVETSEV